MAAVGPLAAQSCTDDDYAAAVDGAGAQLRAFNAEAAPKFQARVKALAAKKGWGEQDYEDTAITYLQDARLAKLDETANALLARIDTLGRREPGQKADCGMLDELKTVGLELLTVMKAKNTYLLSRIDKELGEDQRSTAVAASPTTAAAPVPPKIKDTLPATAPPVSAQAAKSDPRPAATTETTRKSAPTTPWSSSTAAVPPPPAPVLPPAPEAAPAMTAGIPRPSEPLTRPQVMLDSDDGYTIDEIRAATRGLFGGVSTGLASVIEHAFAKSGRPTAYVLGQEGGGAFLGGLRYGEGTLYVRSGGTQPIFWHGPSVGFDFGAAGARTMFLIYKMKEPGDLYRVFSGIDGSAFVVGGVGLTLLGGGDMLLAPIRSGIGVRVGANIGYLRFTATKTWNPF